MSTARALMACLCLAATLALLQGGCSSKSSTAPASSAPGNLGKTFNFSFPATGVSHTYTFPSTGDWNYLCLKHGLDGMRGTVFVRESSLRDSALVQVGMGGNKVYFPDTVTVRPNGVVRWKNVSADVEHTATSN